MDLYIFATLYIVCMAIAAGIRGGVRDEMDGVLDLLAISLWPVWLAGFMLWFAFTILFLLGRSLAGRKK